jgi:hypothetical protein
MTVLTRAELSRYQTSALIGPEPLEHLARPWRAMRQRQRRAELAQMPLAGACPSRPHEGVEPFPPRYGHEQCHGAPAVGYLERLAGSHALEPTAGLLAKLPNSNLLHVLLVEHMALAREA